MRSSVSWFPLWLSESHFPSPTIPHQTSPHHFMKRWEIATSLQSSPDASLHVACHFQITHFNLFILFIFKIFFFISPLYLLNTNVICHTKCQMVEKRERTAIFAFFSPCCSLLRRPHNNEKEEHIYTLLLATVGFLSTDLFLTWAPKTCSCLNCILFLLKIVVFGLFCLS